MSKTKQDIIKEEKRIEKEQKKAQQKRAKQEAKDFKAKIKEEEKQRKIKERRDNGEFCCSYDPSKDPLKRRAGSMLECAMKNKVGLYGHYTIDPAVMIIAKSKLKKQRTEQNIIKERAKVLGILRGLKEAVKYNGSKPEKLQKKEVQLVELKKQRQRLKELNDEYVAFRKAKNQRRKK